MVLQPPDDSAALELLPPPPPLPIRPHPRGSTTAPAPSQHAPPWASRSTGTTTAQCLFFSFTTLTTTGYGDLVPAANPGQSLAISEAVLGQLFLVTALGKIVSNLPGRVRGAGAAAAAE